MFARGVLVELHCTWLAKRHVRCERGDDGEINERLLKQMVTAGKEKNCPEKSSGSPPRHYTSAAKSERNGPRSRTVTRMTRRPQADHDYLNSARPPPPRKPTGWRSTTRSGLVSRGVEITVVVQACVFAGLDRVQEASRDGASLYHIRGLRFTNRRMGGLAFHERSSAAPRTAEASQNPILPFLGAAGKTAQAEIRDTKRTDLPAR